MEPQPSSGSISAAASDSGSGSGTVARTAVRRSARRLARIRALDQRLHLFRGRRLALADGEQQVHQDRSQGQNLPQQNLVRRAVMPLQQLRPNPLRERQLSRAGTRLQASEYRLKLWGLGGSMLPS